MKHTNLWKQIVAVLLVLVLSVSLITPSIAVDADAATKHEVSFEQVDNDSVDIDLPVKDHVATDEEEPQYADTDVVRVSIVLSDDSTLEKGFTAEQIADANARAVKYRMRLESKQEKMEKTISKKALDGEKLDVVWNLTLAANIISANVEYGQIEAIEKVSGVEKVLIETRYEPCVIKDNEATDPNMSTSDEMIGSITAWASGYTGAGSKIAIIDTGADTDHPSLDPFAYSYAVKDTDTVPMTAADTAKVLGQLNAVKSRESTTAEELYVNAKIPYGFNYIDEDLDVTHDNDTQGDHGSHVAGIAAGNRYTAKGDGTYSNALDSVLTQGVAPDAQLLVMKVFGKGGGAYDSDYMAAIEDAMVLGADAANLSLGGGNPGYSHNADAAYEAILQRVTDSGMVVAMSAGNSGNWFENTQFGYPYSESVSWQTDGQPGSFTNSLAVASVDNIGKTGNYIEMDGTKIFYNESLEGSDGSKYSNASILTLAGEHEFVYIDSLGTAEEFEAVKDVLNGKIAVCNRGDISFYVKAENAVSNGAIATIVANNQPGIINMDFSDYTKTQPAVSITLADALVIKEKATAVRDESEKILYYTGKLNIAEGVAAAITPNDYYTMSDFSSWGVPGSMELKPEISAPGGNIYSLKNGGAYQNMSGTSMASPQIAGMTAVVAQYIKENGLSEKTGLSVRALAQSLLMSTAEPMIEDYGKDGVGYYPVLRQGAGLANVGAAVSSGSYLLMDANATDSYKDGKIKAELGDDPDRDGLYSFGFTIYNMENSDTAFTLDSDFFTQDISGNRLSDDSVIYFEDSRTALIPANVTWSIDGQTVETEDPSGLEHCDFNGDGKINNEDGQALLDYVTGVRTEINEKDHADFDADGNIDTYDAYLFFKRLGKSAVLVPANGSVHVTVTAQLSKETLALYDAASDGTGTYVEGYVYATELSSDEGVEGTQHSIPVLGYYGSWSEPSMYDIGSYLEYSNGLEDRPPYMYKAAGNNALNYQTLIIQYEGDSSGYYFGGNPYIDEGFYDEDRNAINPDTTTISKMRFTLIRNAANGRFTIVGDDGKEYTNLVLDQSVDSAYYYTNGERWAGTYASLNTNAVPKAPEGTKLTISLTMAPEYYVDYSGSSAVTDWGALADGATQSYVTYVDKTAPELSEVYFKEDLKNGTKQLIAEAIDNRYVAAGILFDYDTGDIIDKVAGSPEDAKLGDKVALALNADGIDDVTHLMLRVYDYADNYSTFKINLNKDELKEDVSVTISDEALTLYKGQTATLQAEVSPFGVQPDGVTWSSSNEAVATVNKNGIVTAVGKGDAVITATSVKDETKSASCTVNVITIEATLRGALQNADGKAMFYDWNLDTDATWKGGVALASKSVVATTLDSRENVVFSIDAANYNIHKIDPVTGEDIASYPGIPLDSENLPIWDLTYSEAFSTAEKPVFLYTYGPYIFGLYGADEFSAYGYNLSNTLARYTGASAFVAVTTMGESQLDLDDDGVEEQAEMFLALDNAGYVWMLAMGYVNGELEFVPWNYFQTTLPSSLSFPGYEDDMNCSLLYSEEDGYSYLYLSYFDGDTNQIYRMSFMRSGTTLFWRASNIGNFGDKIWPATIHQVTVNGTTADGDSVKADEMSATQNAEVSAISVEKTQAAKIVSKNAPATGSLNVAPSTKSETLLPLDAPVANETKVSNVTVSADEKTVTVNVVAKSDEATTNGLAAVEYDSNLLTLTDVAMYADYTSHKAEAGKVTLGYVDLDGVAAGTVIATLTFSVDPTKVEIAPVITIHQTELNDKQVDLTETLTAEFHKDTEIRNAHDATCTLEGYTGDSYCTVCGKKVGSGTTIPANGHDYAEWVTVVEPKCEEQGVKSRICKVCQHTEIGKIDATGHDWDENFTIDQAPTCTVEGSKSIHCKKCDAKKDVTTIPANGHDYGEWQTIVAPKCQDKGMKVRTCKVCQHTEMVDVDPTGHAWEDDFTVDQEPTCTTDGSKSIHCKNCDAVKDSTAIPATGHAYGEPVWSWTGLESATATFTCANDETHVEVKTAEITNEVTTDPTCTEKGERTYTATVLFDDKTYTDAKTEEIAANGHDTEIVGAKEATCTEDGYTGDEVCKTCKEVIKKGEAIKALGHDTEIVGAKEATCTEDGYTGDEVCKTCKEVVKKGEVIKALGHDYKNGKCTRCGAVRDSVKTGDEANITLWIAVLTMSAAAAAFVVAVLTRKKHMN